MEDESVKIIAEAFALHCFFNDAIVNLLLKKGIINKDELKAEMFKGAERGENEDIRIQSKNKINKWIDEL